MHVVRSQDTVMRRRMVFGELITSICASRRPIQTKLALLLAVFYPVKPHVHGFRAALSDGVIDNADCCSVVCVGIDQ
jgi:hypothetical protein